MAALLLQRLLLSAAFLVQDAVPPFPLFPDLCDLFIDRGHGRFLGGEFFSGRAASFGSAEPGARHFRFFLGQSDAPRADPGHLRFDVVRRRNSRLQFGELLQQVAVGRVVLLQPALDARQLAIANIGRGLRFVLPLQDRLLLFLEFRQRRVLFFGVLFPLQFDLANPFLDRRDPERDFFLFLLQFLERDDFIAHFRKVHRLRATFAAEIDLALLQHALLVAQCDPRLLPANLQPDFAQPCSDETHGIRLTELRLRQRAFRLWQRRAITPRCSTSPARSGLRALSCRR